MPSGIDEMNEAQSPPAACAPRLQRGWRAWSRRGVRGAAFGFFTVFFSLSWVVALPVTWVSPRAHRRFRGWVFRNWARSILNVCGVRTTVVGDLPVRPCFLVANHLGSLDILVIAAHVDATFVSMKELERWPLIGAMARQFGTVFVDRSRKRDIPDVNRAIDAAFERSDAVVIFPEGRQSRGASVLPFRPSLLEPAARNGHALAWAVLHYETGPSDPSASLAIPWVDVPFHRHALVQLALERVDARLEFGRDVMRGGERKDLARALHERVSSRFLPLQ